MESRILSTSKSLKGVNLKLHRITNCVKELGRGVQNKHDDPIYTRHCNQTRLDSVSK